jgi:hypothetical protein
MSVVASKEVLDVATMDLDPFPSLYICRMSAQEDSDVNSGEITLRRQAPCFPLLSLCLSSTSASTFAPTCHSKPSRSIRHHDNACVPYSLPHEANSEDPDQEDSLRRCTQAGRYQIPALRAVVRAPVLRLLGGRLLEI